jgi:cAMP phosphodiesterase
MSDTGRLAATQQQQQPPLKGLKIYIIHVKDTLEDIEPAGETILRQMRTFEEEEKLGCEFVLTSPGMSIFL